MHKGQHHGHKAEDTGEHEDRQIMLSPLVLNGQREETALFQIIADTLHSQEEFGEPGHGGHESAGRRKHVQESPDLNSGRPGGKECRQHHTGHTAVIGQLIDLDLCKGCADPADKREHQQHIERLCAGHPQDPSKDQQHAG